MTPPEASVAGASAGAAGPSAVSSCLGVLKKRADFLRAAQARRHATPGFVLQARRRGADRPSTSTIRACFTCSRYVETAVSPHGPDRRLREIARLELPAAGRPGWDYVLIGRAGTTATREFRAMRDDLRNALCKVHGAQK